MSRSLIVSLALSVASAAGVPSAAGPIADNPVAENLGRAGGIYCAYEVQSDSLPAVPEGYCPVYISHYGRHGSRWPIKGAIYTVADSCLSAQRAAGNLTPLGEDALVSVRALCDNARGHLGELTPLGERQHRAIAERMASRWPELFAEGAWVEARSSVEPRCIMSMAAFCEGLREEAPGVEIRRHASPGDMDFIHHKEPAAEALGSDTASWRSAFSAYRDSVALCHRTAFRLFKKQPAGPELIPAMRALYEVAISEQNIDGTDRRLLDIFDLEELTGLWKAYNYAQYVPHSRSPLGGGAGAAAARTLLSEIITAADAALASGQISADLRFGHDTDLLRLASLMRLEGCGAEVAGPEEAARQWRNFSISPMGANIQLIFFRNSDHHVIVAPRLNEQPISIPMPEYAPGFYDWEALRAKMQEYCKF